MTWKEEYKVNKHSINCGAIWATGAGQYGQLGIGSAPTIINAFTACVGITGASRMDCGTHFAYALKL